MIKGEIMKATVDIKPIVSKIVIKMGRKDQINIYNALVTMIKWTRRCKNQAMESINQTTSPLMWSQEFCTVKFCLPRQSGHTTFIKWMVKSLNEGGSTGELFKKPILIFPNIDIIRSSRVFSEGLSYGYVDIVNRLNEDKFLGRTLDGVIVDCASTLSPENIGKIYNAFKRHAIHNPNFVFVFLE